MDKKEECQEAAIIMECLSRFLRKNGLVVNESYKERLNLLYCMGFVDYGYPEETNEDFINIRIDGPYIVIEFVYVSMIIRDADVEEYLMGRWHLARLGFYLSKLFEYPELDYELDYIKKKGYGVRIESYAGIGGRGYHNRCATLFTPEDLRERF